MSSQQSFLDGATLINPDATHSQMGTTVDGYLQMKSHGSTTAHTVDCVAVTVQLADVSAASSAYVACPVAGKVVLIQSCLQTAITGANAALTTEINGTAITDGGWTVTQSGSAAGDVDSATPTAANTVAVGDTLEVVTDGASSTTSILVVTFYIQRT